MLCSVLGLVWIPAAKANDAATLLLVFSNVSCGKKTGQRVAQLDFPAALFLESSRKTPLPYTVFYRIMREMSITASCSMLDGGLSPWTDG